MADRFKALSIKLSQLLYDPVTDANAGGVSYTADQRTLSLNEAEKIVIAKIGDEMKFEEIAKKLPTVLGEISVIIPASGFTSSPANSIRCYRAIDSLSKAMVFVSPDEWYGVLGGYNTEQNDTVYNKRWTEYAGKIKAITNIVNEPISVIYLKDHVDMTPDGANDFIVPSRYDPELLKIAFDFITGILHIK